jgi:hypothetical protein
MLTLDENYSEDYLFGLKLKRLYVYGDRWGAGGNMVIHRGFLWFRASSSNIKYQGIKFPFLIYQFLCGLLHKTNERYIWLAEGAYTENKNSIHERTHKLAMCKSGYFSLPKIIEAMQHCSLLPQFHVRDPWLLPWQWNVSSSGTVTVYVVELACSVSEAKHSKY